MWQNPGTYTALCTVSCQPDNSRLINSSFPLRENSQGRTGGSFLAQLVPWDEFEAEYAQQFSPTQGSPAKSFRVALGALIIKERLGTSDEETVEQIRDNPYLQYFLGFEEYTETPPFEASMFVHFRKRLSLSMVGRVNERMVQRARLQSTPTSELNQSQDPQAGPLERDEVKARSGTEMG